MIFFYIKSAVRYHGMADFFVQTAFKLCRFLLLCSSLLTFAKTITYLINNS